MYLTYIAIYVSIFYIYALVGIRNKSNANELTNYIPKSKCWVTLRSMRSPILRIVTGWAKTGCEIVQGLDVETPVPLVVSIELKTF